MPERYSPISEFDPSAVSEALQTEAVSTRDVAHGDGQTLAVGDGKAVLEVYPDAQVARVTTTDARVELFRVPGYSVNPGVGRVVFEQGAEQHRTRLLVHRDGKVSFHPVLRAVHTPQTADTAHDAVQATLPLGSGSAAPTVAQKRTSDRPPQAESAEPEELQLQGRLGRNPWFGRDGETLVGKFPLAVHDNRGDKTWYDIVMRGAVAEQLQGASRQGVVAQGPGVVTVTGRPVIRREQTDDGQTKVKREFHASAFTVVEAPKRRPQRR